MCGKRKYLDWDFGYRSRWCGIEPWKVAICLKQNNSIHIDYYNGNLILGECEQAVKDDIMYKKMDNIILKYKIMKYLNLIFPKSLIHRLLSMMIKNGVYQMVEDVILMYDSEIVLPHILKALDSTYEGVKYWGIQILSNFPSECLFNPLVNLLKVEDEDIKLATITAIAQLALNNVKKEEVINILEKECKSISDEDIKEFAEEVLLDIQNSTL